MNNPQETSVSTQDTFRLIKRDEPTSNSVSALVSRLHTCAILEGKAKEKVNGTIIDVEDEEKKDDPPFPWHSKIKDLYLSAVGSKSIKTLENLLTVYLQKVTSSVNDCYQKPNRATKLRIRMNSDFVYFRSLYQDIKEPMDNTMYLQKMTELMAMYLDLEIASSRRRKETTKKVSGRMATALHMFLDGSEDNILDALMRAKAIKVAEKEVCCPILKKVLTSFQKRQMQDTLYVRYLLVFKLWKKIVSDSEMRKKINVLAIEKLPAPANFTDRYKRFNNVLPRAPANKDITTFYMQAKIDVTKACQNFMKISKDPTLPTMPDKPLFCDKTVSGKGNAYDGVVGPNPMINIWSSEDNTSNKKSNTIKKKGKNKKGDKKKEKSDSISETESTPEVLTPVKTPTWQETVEVRADVVMINSSQPPPPGTEPPPPARIPPPPPPPPPQIKPQPPPKPLAPLQTLKAATKPIATIVAMKKELEPVEEPVACPKTEPLVPEIDIKVEPGVEMAPSPAEPMETEAARFGEPMETETEPARFPTAEELEQAYDECCEVQLGDQDLPYIEEEVVEPCNPVGFADSPEADFGKVSAADRFGASQAKVAAEGVMRPEETQTDVQIVPLTHIKSERVDSPELEPVSSRLSSQPNGAVSVAAKPGTVAVIPTDKLVAPNALPRKSRTLSSEGLASPSKSRAASSDARVLPNKVRTASNEGHVSAHKVRTAASEAPSSSAKVRTPSSEGHTTTAKVRTSSNERHSSSPKIQTSTSESSPKVRTSSSEGHKVRTSSSEGSSAKIRTPSGDSHSSSPKVRTPSGESSHSPTKARTPSTEGHGSSKVRAPSGEGHLSALKVKTLSSESSSSSPKRRISTSEESASKKVRTLSGESHKSRTSSGDSNSSTSKVRTSSTEGNAMLPKIQTSSTERSTASPQIRTHSVEGNVASPKVRTSLIQGNVASPKIQTSSTERSTASPQIRTSSTERKAASPQIRTSSSERNSVSPQVRTSSTERSTTSPQIRTSSTERSTVSPQVRTPSSERSSASPRVRTSSTERNAVSPQVRTPSIEGSVASPKIRTSSTERSIAPPQVRTSSAERSAASPQIRTTAIERNAVSPQIRTSSTERSITSPQVRTPSTERNAASPRIRTPSIEGSVASPKIRTSSNEINAVSPQIRTTSTERKAASPQIRTSLMEATPLSPKVHTSSSERHRARTPSNERQTPSPKIQTPSNVHGLSPNPEKQWQTSTTMPLPEKMPTLRAELPSPSKSERRDKTERPQANGARLLAEDGSLHQAHAQQLSQFKEHTLTNRDNVYYRCGPHIGEYGQIIYPQNPNESMSQKESMILKRLRQAPTQATGGPNDGQIVYPQNPVELASQKWIVNEKADAEVVTLPIVEQPWPETYDRIVERPSTSRHEMPPPKSRSPRSRSPRTPSPRADVFAAPQPRVDLAPFAAFAAPKPPSPTKAAPSVAGDALFAAPRLLDAEPRYAVDDIYLAAPLPALDFSVDGLDFDGEPYPLCDDALFGGYPFNEEYMFNMSELSHTCMVDPNLVEQRTVPASDEPFAYPTYANAVDPMELRTAREVHSFLTSRPGWPSAATEAMPMGALLDDDDSLGFPSYPANGFPGDYNVSEFLNPAPAFEAPAAAKPPEAKPADDGKASRKRPIHATTRPHLTENSAALNCAPLGGSKPPVARAGVRSKGRSAAVAKKEAISLPVQTSPPGSPTNCTTHKHDAFFGNGVNSCDNDYDPDLDVLQPDSDLNRDKPRTDGGNKRPVTRSVSKVTTCPSLYQPVPATSKRQRKIR